MNYPMNVKPKLSGMAIASGVLFALAALVTLFVNLTSGSFASMNFFYKGLFVFGVFAFVAVAVLLFVRANEIFLAIPFTIIALRSLVYLVAFVITFPLIDYCRWFGVASGLSIFLPNVLIYILTLASFILMVVTCVTWKNRKVLGIAAGVIYALNTVFSWLIFPLINNKIYGYSVNFRYITEIFVRNFQVYIDDILIVVAMLLLSFALSKLAPAMPKYAPYGYAPNGYVPNGYAQRPPVQNNYGYAPVQTQMQNTAPVQTSAPQMQNIPTLQEESSNVVPQTLCENAAPSVENTDTEKIAEQLSAYKKMLDDGLISEADFEAKKKQLLGL